MQVSASAPGKLVLLGEYAVLHGAPALVMAVDRRAHVWLKPSTGAICHVDSRSGTRQTGSFSLSADGQARWTGDTNDSEVRFSLVTEIVRSLCLSDSLDAAALRALEINLDTRHFFARVASGSYDKLGLGSSAALTVALASALALYAGQAALVNDRVRWIDRLRALHRDFQRGQGSGLDIAASMCGGLIRYQLTGTSTSPAVSSLAWPAELHGLFVWSGRSASTRGLLELVGAWRAASRDAGVLIAELGEAAAVGERAAVIGDAAALLAAVEKYVLLLARLGEESGADIVSAEHRAIARLARAAGAVYKPCGAGGGDIGVALAAEPERVQYLGRSLSDAGYTLVPLRVDPEGLTTQTSTE